MQNHLSVEFLAPSDAQLLKSQGLDQFSSLWDYQGEWFEPPNEKRGGWSGVNFLSLSNEGKSKGYYLKRQSQYQRRTFSHPIQGEPTFTREFVMLKYLINQPVHTPELVYFAQNRNQSILMTAALEGYEAADQWFQNRPDLDKRPVLSAMARAIKAMHQAGVEHRALFLKHLFVQSAEGSFKVAIIDFEKARRTILIGLRWPFDLKRLLQRADVLSTVEKNYFIQQYFQTQDLNWWQQRICHWLVKAKKK